MLFASTNPEATATLHVAGYRGGDEPTFKLGQPRYNRARHMVSYKAKPLNNKPLPGRAARAAATARTFGGASLAIQGAPQPSLLVEPTTHPCPERLDHHLLGLPCGDRPAAGKLGDGLGAPVPRRPGAHDRPSGERDPTTAPKLMPFG